MRALRDERFLHERAVGPEHLQPIARAIADVEQAVVRQHRRSAPGCGTACAGGAAGSYGPQVVVVRLVAVRAPVPLHLAGVGVEHRDALVEIAVGDVGLVGLRVDEDLRDAAEVLRSLLPPT